MPLFQYQAKDRSGRTVSGTVDATNRREAAAILQDQGFYPTRVESRQAGPATTTLAAGPPDPSPASRLLFFVPGLTPKAQAAFFRRLSSLLTAGVSLSAALESLRRTSRGWLLRRALVDMQATTQAGSPCSLAMQRHPQVFSPLQVALFAAGERVGRMEVACNRIADLAESSFRMWLKVMRAAAYPIGALVVASLVLPVVHYFLSGGSLLDVVLSPVRFLGGLVLEFYILYLLLKVPAISYAWDQMKLVLPFVAGLTRRVCLCRFLRAFADLFDAGVPVATGLILASDACGNRPIARRLKRVAPQMEQGMGVADALESSRVLSVVLVDLIRTGETTGQMDSMMRKGAEYLEAEAEASSGAAMAVLPLLIWLVFAAMMIGQILAMAGVYSGQIDKYINM
ncbi:MAG TPA: type II secretion system F family protein [Armatimonadota bacterium]